MIIAGTTEQRTSSNHEANAKTLEEFKKEFGRTGITAAMREDEPVGYPSNVGSQGNYTFAVGETTVTAKELKPGDIGYSSSERFKTGPQLLTREAEK